jgi:transcription elongation factor GreA
MNTDDNKLQITKTGYESLRTELTELTEIKRPALVERLANARLQGDLAENSDYHNAKDELEFLDGRISELEEVVKNAEVVNNANDGKVSVGTKVTVKLNGKDMVFSIVGEWEADPAKQMISHTSPLGTALTGKKVGDKVEVEAPAGKIVYEIVSVE